MKNKLLIALALLAFASGCKSPKTAMTPDEVESLVADAYVHCFPIVENYKGIFFYAVFEKSPKFTPFNTLNMNTKLYTPEDKFVVSPNNDTYYSVGALDLRAEPVIFKMPNANGRYYVFQLVGQTTDNFSYIGTRLRGDQAAIYAVTSPNYKGKLPEGIVEIKSPSEFVAVVGRTAVNAEDSIDREDAKKLQDQYQIGVMSKFYPEFKPQSVDRPDFPMYNESTLTTIGFFATLNFLLQYMKLSDDEQKIMEKFKAIGIVPGGSYKFADENPQFKTAIESGIKKGIERVNKLVGSVGTVTNGWDIRPMVDYFGTNYDLRTAVAKFNIYANCPIEAAYPFTNFDQEGKQLNGKNEYQLTFPAGKLPPVKFFWSLTLYDQGTQLLVANPMNRYSVGDRTKGLIYGKDSSLTIYISNKKPKEGTSNWLPAPEGDFNIMMRLYGPKEEVLNKSWIPEAIVKMNK